MRWQWPSVPPSFWFCPPSCKSRYLEPKMADIGMGGYTACIRGYYRLLAHPTSFPGQWHPNHPIRGHWLTHLRRICDIPSRRLLSAVLYGETPLGADRAEEVRLTAKRKPRGCAPHPARPGGPKGKGQFGIVKKCMLTDGKLGFSYRAFSWFLV